ncbi:hypothetical protein [Burkholderia sp. BCC1988]|uniref:hypothetical protein n=1 Tax=Burkholderia sp. BCC1988 TaxID=2817443 RepID=UPI002AAF62EB|nr:hypothetical protein [Burkholderia sp. BCC1988]
MFIGFIPVLFACAAALVSLRNLAAARLLWSTSALLVVVWTAHHGSHHIKDLMTLGSW